MESQTVFEKGWELDRLTVQNQLLRECELPVYQKLLEGKSGKRTLLTIYDPESKEEFEEYVKTDDYIKEMAEERLNLVDPNEIIFKPSE